MIEGLEFIAREPFLLLPGIALLGLLVGSFLNVVIHRLPIMMEREWRTQCAELVEGNGDPASLETFNLIHPRSRCPSCGHQITALENVPLVSWLVLKGKCSSCDAPIPIRYPLVEMTTGILSVVVAWRLGGGWEMLFILLLTWALIAASAIDFDHQLLPDSIILPFLWLGLLLNTQGVFTTPASAVIGAAAGYFSLWALFHLFRLVTGKEGMGYGDFKLFALFGAWLGWEHLIQIIILSSAVGAIVGIVLILSLGRDKNVPIPFGPYLAAAGWISLLWGNEINRLYLEWSGLAF